MADQVITITVPDAKVATALQGFLAIYPNNEMTSDDPPVQKYNNVQWVAEKMRRLLVRDVRRGLQMLANQAATVEEDDDMATSS